MTLGSERDDDVCVCVWGGGGGVRSREHLTPLMLIVQVVFPRDSLVKFQVLPLVVSLQLLKRPRELVIKWQEDWKKYNMKQNKGVLQSLWQ